MNLDFEKEISDVEAKLAKLSEQSKEGDQTLGADISSLKRKMKALTKKIYSSLTPWQTVQIARHPERPLLSDYISGMFDEFIELHGDRNVGDDRALIGGFAKLDGQRVMLIGMDKGKTVEDKIRNNFGMSNPEGYRKALRLMRLAEKYRLPIVCLVDTPAAYPGKEAEERGQAEAIARNLTEMAMLEVPVVVVVTGEGGSGGALGVAVGDTVMMLSHSVYSVIPPEGCAAILWRDADKAPDAAEALKLTADSLLELGIIDEVIPEPDGGAHRDYKATFEATKKAIIRHVKQLSRYKVRRLTEKRFEKFAKIGKFDSRKYSKH